MPDQQNWQLYWWQRADEVRGRAGSPDALRLVRNALAHDRRLDWRALAAVTRYGEAPIADPQVIAEFALAYTSDRPRSRVLDPWAGLGVTLAALDAGERVESAVAIEINQAVHDLARDVTPSGRTDWRLGDAAEVLPGLESNFDLIVGSPPIGLPSTRLRASDPPLDLRASATYTMLVQAALRLARDGAMIVVLPEGFFHPSSAKVRETLASIGVHPSAALALPASSFATSLNLSLVVFTHVARDDLFVAQLDPAVDLNAIVANLRVRRNAKLPQLGRTVTAARFVSWSASLLADEIESAARAMGLHPVAAASLCAHVRAPSRLDAAFVHEPNAVYLPKLGTSPAVRSVDEFVIKPHSYLQLIVRPEIVDPEYLAAFLSSPLGRKVRAHLASGTIIPQVSVGSFRAGSIPLPPTIEHQRAAVRAARRLGEIREAIDGLERELWDRPLRAKRAEAGLRRVLEGNGPERWTESLPFPLASVLWRFHAEEDVERRVGYLVHFFEATAVFLVNVLLSGLQGDPRTLADVAKVGGTPDAYTRGSIGIWADLLSRLARRARELRSADPALSREIFRISDLERLDGLADKSVVAAIKDEAAQFRRDWVGHAAVVSVPEWERRLALAEATLARVRAGLGDAFVGLELIRAGHGGNHGGVITTSVEWLTGSRSLFRKGKVALREWPEENGLYLLEDGASLALQLNPLFSLQRAPELVEDACYFYDRIEDGVIRWISFHFEPQPEIMRADPSVASLIDELNRIG